MNNEPQSASAPSPSPSPSPSSESNNRRSEKKEKQRQYHQHLPTSPPDPRCQKNNVKISNSTNINNKQQQREVLEYFKRCDNHKGVHQLSQSDPILGPAVAVEDAFDHLEKLYNLVEQFLILRQQNVRLQRRVRNLEFLRKLEKMNKSVETNLEKEKVPDRDDDQETAMVVETIFDAALSIGRKHVDDDDDDDNKLKEPRYQSHHFIKQPNRRRISLTGPDELCGRSRRTSATSSHQQPPSSLSSSPSLSSKISKWTKVKAAFKWEKASNSVISDTKSYDTDITSGITGTIQPINCELARYLRVPYSVADESEINPGDSGAGAADTSSLASLSTTSSIENLQGRECKRRRSSQLSEDEIGNSLSKFSFSSETKDVKHVEIKKKKIGKRKRTVSSNRSDEIIKLDMSAESDNEDAFEANENTDENTIPSRIKEKYKEILSHDIIQKNANNRTEPTDHLSKWNRIKRAFLNQPNSLNNNNDNDNDDDDNRKVQVSNQSPDAFSFKLEENLEKATDSNDTLKIQEEIQRNYEQLQKKLSLEFQMKLQEWEKIKSQSTNSSGISVAVGGNNLASEDQKDEAFLKKIDQWQRIKSHPSKMQAIEMMKQENLPSDFKKKLEEWQRMKKCDGAVSTSTTIPIITIGPKRKLSDWSKWKTVHQANELMSSNKIDIETPNTNNNNNNTLESNNNNVEIKLYKTITTANNSPSRQSKKRKNSNQKELYWLEKELCKIEKEKNRLERERQKFTEREERLTKLRKSVMGNGEKKEIFIHTPSGFHRFEGISKKFTQKLYEWEKSQGIGPESSTIALLSSSFTPNQQCALFGSSCATMTRSKSDDSLMVTNNPNELISHQPSSLSLNNMEEVEKGCMIPMTDSTLDDIFGEHVNADEEPEALIVEVEDVIVETASPLGDYCSKEQLIPIYRKQPPDDKNCLKQQKTTKMDTTVEEFYPYSQIVCQITNMLSELILKVTESSGKNIDITIKQQQLTITNTIMQKLKELKLLIDSSSETVQFPTKILCNIQRSIQDLLQKLIQKVEKLDGKFNDNDDDVDDNDDDNSKAPHSPNKGKINVANQVNEVKGILCDLKRYLSYMKSSQERRKGDNVTQINPEESERENQIKQGAIKKNYKWKQETSLNRSDDVTDDDDSDDDSEKVAAGEVLIKTTRKLFSPLAERKATRAIKQTPKGKPIIVASSQKLLELYQKRSSSSTSKSTRLPPPPPPLPLSPNSQRKTQKEISPCIRLMMNRYNQKVSEQDCHSGKSAASNGSTSPIVWRSPPPPSPLKHEKRMVKLQTEKYLKEMHKKSSHVRRRSASATHLQISKENADEQSSDDDDDDRDNVTSSPTFEKPSGKILSRSVSARTVRSLHDEIQKQRDNVQDEKKIRRPTSLKLNITPPYEEVKKINTTRQYRLKKAREEFLTSPEIPCASAPAAAEPSSAPAQIETANSIKYSNNKNRLSHFSVESESSCDSSTWSRFLIKSASAGMINIEADSFKQFDPAIHKDGYVSLPRTPKNTNESFFNGKFKLANIASRFRKVKIRRRKDGKNHNKPMNTITVLCRQSLVVDINNSEPGASQQNLEQSSQSTIPPST